MLKWVIEVGLPTGINRNIVECKEGGILALGGRNDVLIETLWNVKKRVIHHSSYLEAY